MTIRDMIRDNPGLFYSQSWYDGEAFMDVELPEDSPTTLPTRRSYVGIPPELILWPHTEVVPAVVLVHLFVGNHTAPIWDGYFWTSDTDHLGQRVYVGSNGKGLEIHRHINISPRFGVPAWK